MLRSKKTLRSKKAQSTLEYIIIFTTIVAAILVVANGVIKQRVTTMVTHVADEANNAVQHIDFTNTGN